MDHTIRIPSKGTVIRLYRMSLQKTIHASIGGPSTFYPTLECLSMELPLVSSNPACPAIIGYWASPTPWLHAQCYIVNGVTLRLEDPVAIWLIHEKVKGGGGTCKGGSWLDSHLHLNAK